MQDNKIDKIMELCEVRKRIMNNNSNYIFSIVIFYENFLLHSIIKPMFFTKNYDNYIKVNEFIKNRMNLMDRYKIILEIAEKRGINKFKKIDKFIEMRNSLAHNDNDIEMFNIESGEVLISFGGKSITWNEYISKINEWAVLSYNMAEFVIEVFKTVNTVDYITMLFDYCKVDENGVLIPCSIILINKKGEYECITN